MGEGEVMSHTPGPWRHEPYENVYQSAVIGGLHQIALVHYDDFEQSNARLIAAAPELLEALENFIETVEHVDPGVYRDSIEQAQAAIRKARGQQ